MKTKLFSVSIKDCIVQTFRSGGPGGQNQNKRNTGVRVIHLDSNARGEARDSRTQEENKKNAFRRMTETKEFRTWLKIECSKIEGRPTVEQLVEEAMKPENIRVEVRNENREWVNEDNETK